MKCVNVYLCSTKEKNEFEEAKKYLNEANKYITIITDEEEVKEFKEMFNKVNE